MQKTSKCCKAKLVCFHPPEYHDSRFCYQRSCFKCGKDEPLAVDHKKSRAREKVAEPEPSVMVPVLKVLRGGKSKEGGHERGQ